jgi:hypothetical protein
MTWQGLIRTLMDVLIATDFFTGQVWNWLGLANSYLFFYSLRPLQGI